MQQKKQKKITRTMMHQLINLIFEKHAEKQTFPEDQKSELLADTMIKSLPEVFFKKGLLPNHLSVLCNISGISKTKTLKTVIKNDKVELGLLIKIKDYFKELSIKSTDQIEHHIYNVIYYAIIACALLYHHKRISSYSYNNLEKSFSRLSKEDWLPDYILKLYQQAQEYCCENMEKLTDPQVL